MIVTEEESEINKRNAITGSQNLWPDAIVPFLISDNFTGKLLLLREKHKIIISNGVLTML